MNEHDRIVESEFERRWEEGWQPPATASPEPWGEAITEADVAAHQDREEQRTLRLDTWGGALG